MSKSAPPATVYPPSTFGASLRALRQQRRLSLAHVAAATGISASFLSLVETGKSDITVGRVTRLVEFFGISVLDLLPELHREDTDIIRESDQQLVSSPAEGIDMYLMISDRNRTMLPMLLVFEPGASLAEAGRHSGEEFVYVLSGELELEVDDRPARTLAGGDSAYYSAERPHRFSNPSSVAPLRVICVHSPPAL